MSDPRPPLSYAHHGVEQRIAPVGRGDTNGGWRVIVVGGVRMIVPPASGRAHIYAALFGRTNPALPPRTLSLRLLRHKPSGEDQTGLDSIVVARSVRKSYCWSGWVQPNWPMTLEIEQVGGRPSVLVNVAVKLDWFASADKPVVEA